MIYTVTLSPALDYLMWLDHFEEGGLNRALRTSYRAGGKGINVSVVLHRLGYPSVCLGFTAGFTGRELVRLLEAEGIAHKFIDVPKGSTRINVKVKSDTETEINADGPAITAEELDQLIRQAGMLISEDILILSGKPPKNMPDDIYSTIISTVFEKKVRTVVDASGENLLPSLDKKPYLIKPNKAELEEISHSSLDTIGQITAAARKLQDQGAQNVLVSLGGNGAFLAADDGHGYICGIPQGDLIDSTGAGDSMVAGFIAKDLDGASREECLRFAVACGSASSYSSALLEPSGLEQVYSRMPKTVSLY